MSRFPLLPFTIPFILGIAFYFFAGAAGWFVFLAAVVALVAYLTRRRLIALALLGLVTGYFVALLRAPGSLPPGHGVPRLYSGVVKGESGQGAMKVLIMDIDSCDGKRCESFLVKALLPTLGIGVEECDRVSFVTHLTPLSHDTDLPDEIDYNASLARRGVVGECYIVPDSVRYCSPEPGVLNDVRRLRVDVAAILSEGALSSEATDFLIATLTGERDVLRSSQRDLFSRVGLAHLLALSGLHVGIIALVLSVILFPLGLAGFRRWAAALTVIALWGFAVMTGLTPSVTRSVIMFTVFIVTVMIEREWTPVNALCIAALIILFFSPYALFSLGFQLSFLAVLSIIVFAEVLNPVKTPGSLSRWGVMMITVPVAAMLGTGIISAFYFHHFPLFFLLSNIPVALILPALLGGGAVKVVAGSLGFPTGCLDSFLNHLYGFMDGIVRSVEGFPGATWNNLHISALSVGIYFLSLVLFGLWLYRKRTVYLVAAAALILFSFPLNYLLKEQYLQEELFITRSHSETTMLVRDKDRLFYYTTAHPSQEAMNISRDSARYAVYILKRGLKGPESLPDGYRSESLIRQGNVMVFRAKRLQFVTSASNPVIDRLDYAVVCRGFRGDVVDLVRRLGADTVLLSSDLDLRRHDRYLSELEASGIPHRSLRSAPLILR